MSSGEVAGLLRQLGPRRVLVMGIGNPWRGDDGAGLFLAGLMGRELKRENWSYLLAGEHPEGYVSEIVRFAPEVILLIDAARFGGEQGELKLLDPSGIDLLRVSTHAYGIPVFLAYLARTYPCTVYTIGIQGADYTLHDSALALSPSVQERLVRLVEEVAEKP